MDADDATLLARWREGDKPAGNALFQRHFASIHRFFRAKLTDAAEDLTQQTFLAAVRNADTYRAEGSVRAWLFGIARKRLLTHLRDRGRDRDDLGREHDLAERSIADLLGPGAGTAVDAVRERALLLRALRSLPLDLQIALELHYWEDLTVPEIAAVVDAPEGTVKRRLQRGREKLIERLRAQAEDPELAASTEVGLDTWIHALRTHLADPTT